MCSVCAYCCQTIGYLKTKYSDMRPRDAKLNKASVSQAPTSNICYDASSHDNFK